MKQKYSHIIWDWNGTLFDDVAWCIECINVMLAKRELPIIQDISAYHDVFVFPIIQYYTNIGFDFQQEPFEKLAKEYILLYHSNKSGNSKLHANAENVLTTIYNMGVTQSILSASEISNLLSQMNEFNIDRYFDEVLGLPDIYGKSKIDIGLDYMTRKNIDKALVIGDSVHDYDVATALGADCVLIPNGHQGKEALIASGVPVFDDISCIIPYIDNFA
jgi:phosphoglycolate phosphatase